MTYIPSPQLQSKGPVGRRALMLVFGMLCLAGLSSPQSAPAQTTGAEESGLIERYRAARLRLLVRRHVQRRGRLHGLPPQQLSTPTDSLRPSPSVPKTVADRGQTFPLHDVRPVHKLERNWFREQFSGTHWSFLGATPHHTFLDTTRTADLRARLQARFGDPTQTLGDAPFDSSRSERPQFEYWFVVNDSIPVQVTDARGPDGRGLILAAARPYRAQLRALRSALLSSLRHSERAPYVDYYYDDRRERWYRTGFDGQRFFHKRISRADILPGRRPHIDTVRTPPDSVSSPTQEGSP